MSGRAEGGMGPGTTWDAVGKPWVVKVGGGLCDEPGVRAQLARACAAEPHPLVLVHGGGGGVTRLQQSLGLEPRFDQGRRVTGARDLAAVEMALSGTVNKALVRDLIAAGRQAVGLSGCDGSLVRCSLLPGLGQVGAPATIKPFVLHTLLDAGLTPVVSPVSLGPTGEAVNVNADEVACAIAAALGSERLLLLSDVSGVKVDDEWRLDLAGDEVERLIARGEVTDGMIPKLRSAAAAVEAGVGEVVIAGFAGSPLAQVAGTRVHAKEAPRHV